MTSFDNREKSEEARYKHDQDLSFRVMARRNKLLGLWAAERMGLPEDESAAYAKQIVELQLDKDGDHAILRKILADLEFNGLTVKDSEALPNQMSLCLSEAKDQLTA
jgi:hypothetical protein